MPSRLSNARYTPHALKPSPFKCKLLFPCSRYVPHATTYLFNSHIFRSNQNNLHLHYSLSFEVSYGLHNQINHQDNYKLQSRHTFRLNLRQEVEASWNVMAHVQKPDFVFRRNGRVHLNRRGRQFSRLLAAEVCASAIVMLDTPCTEVVWRVLATFSIRLFPLHFPSYASPCAITFQLKSIPPPCSRS